MKYINFLLLVFTAVFFMACAVAQTAGETQFAVKQISVKEAREATGRKDVQFIDVRTEAEYKNGHAPNTMNLTLDVLSIELDKLDPEKPTYVICQSGYRSSLGTSVLENAGFKKIYNVMGGTTAWINAGFETEVSGAACATSK